VISSAPKTLPVTGTAVTPGIKGPGECLSLIASFTNSLIAPSKLKVTVYPLFKPEL
jgi:hypothetical protein